MSQWVQSKYSKDATKWEVTHDTPLYWQVKGHTGGEKVVLKEEYIPCDPPVQWVDCLDQVALIGNGAAVTVDGILLCKCPP
ncbi:MAG: hypothetical protein OEV77_08490, partial [Nitrospira sp.]|nr:hypothetical protein [Nitrospira sp.]